MEIFDLLIYPFLTLLITLILFIGGGFLFSNKEFSKYNYSLIFNSFLFLILITSLFAIMKTKGNTMFLYLVPLLLFKVDFRTSFYFRIKNLISLISLKDIFLLSLTSFLISFFTCLIFYHPDIYIYPESDNDFYSQLSVLCSNFGVESFNFANWDYDKENLPNTNIYHFFEIWVNALNLDLFNKNPLKMHIFVTLLLPKVLIFIFLYFFIYFNLKSKLFLFISLLPFIIGVFFLGHPYLEYLQLQPNFLLFKINYLSLSILFLVFAWYDNNYDLVLFISCLLPFIYVTSLLLSVFVIVVLCSMFYFQQIKKINFYYLLPYLFLVIYSFICYTNLKEYVVIPSLIDSSVSFIAIIKDFLYYIWFRIPETLLSISFPILTISILLYLKKNNHLHFLFVLNLIFIFISFMSLILTPILLLSIDGVQFINNPLEGIRMVVIFFNLFYLVKFLSLSIKVDFIIVFLILILPINSLINRLNGYRFNLSKGGASYNYSKKYVDKLVSISNLRVVEIKDSTDFIKYNFFSRVPFLYNYSMMTSFVNNGINVHYPVWGGWALADFNWDFNNNNHVKWYNHILIHSKQTSFVKSKFNSNESFDKRLINFMKKNNVSTIIGSKSVTLSESINKLVILHETDSLSSTQYWVLNTSKSI